MPPVLIRNHLQSGHVVQPLLLVDGARVHVPEPALTGLLGKFVDDGAGGLIAAAMSATGCGYIDGQGRWVVPPTLQEARSFTEDGLARFQAGGLWGFVDLRGHVVIDAKYEEVGAFVCGRAPVRIGKGWRYIDRDGAFALDETFSLAGSFSACGLAYARTTKSPRFGFVDTAGNWAIAPQFFYRTDFSRHGVAPAALKEDRWGLVDAKGQWIVQPTYSWIDALDDDGVAHCRIDVRGGNGRAVFIDTAGNVVIPEREDLAPWMIDGLVRRRDSRYVGRDGDLATSTSIAWGSHFTGHGFAIARAWQDSADDRRGGGKHWGILRADGQFHHAPDDVLEPLTSKTYDIMLPEWGTPLAPFVTRGGDVAFLDRDGAVAYRLQREITGGADAVVLRDAHGNVLWSGEPGVASKPAKVFFAPDPSSFLETVDDCDGLPGLAATLLERTRDKLAQLVAGDLSLDDPDDDDDDDSNYRNADGVTDWKEDKDVPAGRSYGDEDETEYVADAVRTSQRVFRAYLNESTWGTYQFLYEERLADMRRMFDKMAAVLTAAFGEPSPEPDYPGRPRGASSRAWPFGEGTQRYWIELLTDQDTGDGTCWANIWLHCAPDTATLEAAMAAAPEMLDDD